MRIDQQPMKERAGDPDLVDAFFAVPVENLSTPYKPYCTEA